MRYLQISFYVLLMGLVFIVLLDLAIMPIFIHFKTEVTVPELTHLEAGLAVQQLDEAGLQVERKEKYAPEEPKGIVLGQNPEAGAVVKEGRSVQLVVSTNVQMVAVPNVVLTTLRDAKFAITSSGLAVGAVRWRPSRDVPRGIVLEQSADAQGKIENGTPIDLIVSSGRVIKEAIVPNLIDKSLAEVKKLLSESYLKLGRVSKNYLPMLLPGTVINQSIDSTTTVPPYTEIDLVVSTDIPEEDEQ